MAFNINAQVILSGPKNLKSVTKNIKKQLSGLTATVNVKIPQGTGRRIGALNKHLTTLNSNLATLKRTSAGIIPTLNTLSNSLGSVAKNTSKLGRSYKTLNKSLSGVTKQTTQASSALQSFGKEAANAIRRFAAFTVVTSTIYGFIRSVQDATKNALQFQRELVKLQQITGQGGKALDGIRNSVDSLSRSLGIDANQLLKIGKIFAQTGQTLDQVQKSLKAVARSSLAPTFGTMESTAEGLVAALAQFDIQAKDSEKVLGSLNAVSKKFAVESGDLISAIRRAGGVFAATANQMTAPIDSLNELISIFTAVRSTTRETADTIATGLRTIFTRIQRPRTIEFLKQFGIELVDLRGNFKGIFPAFKELSKGLQGIIAQGDTLTLARITEELGGIRQVGKLIPAIKNFDKALRALDVASKGAAEGLGKDVALALQPLAKQFEQLQARFESFVRTIASSTTFQNLAKVAISTANAFITMAEALQPLVPLLTSLAAVKISSGLLQFGQGFAGAFRGGGGAGGLGKTVGNIAGGGGGGGPRDASAIQRRLIGATKALRNAVRSNSLKVSQNTAGLTTVTSSLGTLSTKMSRLSAQLARLPRAISSVGFGFGSRPRARARGGKIEKFASGGYVKGPSHGAGGVLAELEGGEYVVPKRYAEGGAVKLRAKSQFAKKYGAFLLRGEGAGGIALRGQNVEGSGFNKLQGKINSKLLSRKSSDKAQKAVPIGNFGLTPTGLPSRSFKSFLASKKGGNLGASTKQAGASFNNLTPEVKRQKQQQFRKSQTKSTAISRKQIGPKGAQYSSINLAGPFPTFPVAGKGEVNTQLAQTFEKVARKTLADGIKTIKKSDIVKAMKIDPIHESESHLFNFSNLYKGASEAVEGFLLEGVIGALTNATIAGGGANFDFPKPFSKAAKGRLKKLFGNDAGVAALRYADAKRQMSTANTGEGKLVNKIARVMGASEFDIIDFKAPQRKAAGGNVFKPMGTDTVPAMLTPGEFVINKASAQKIGYSSLGKMNRYAKGGAVGHAQYLQLGGMAERPGAIQGVSALFGLATTFATLDFSSENASESLRTLAIASSFLLPQLSGLGDAFKGFTTASKGLFSGFTAAGKAAKAASKADRAAQIARLKTKVEAGVGAAAGSRAAKKAAGARRGLRQLQIFDPLKKGLGKVGKGGLAATVATLLADPVIDFIGSKTFGQQGGRAGRDVQRAEAEGRVLGGAKGLISGAATGAFIGSFAGPVGTLVGGIIGGVGGLIEGALRGAKLEGLRQSEFDSIQKLQKANEAVTQTFEALSKSGHALTTAQLAQGTEVLRQRRQDAAGVERASLRRREEEDKGFGGLNIVAGISDAANTLTGGFVGRSFQQQAEDRQTASVQAALSSVTQADVAAATEVATRATEKLVNGIGNLSPQMLKAIANTGDMTAALAQSDPTVRGFARQLDKLHKEALAASVMAEVGKQLQILNDAGDRKGAVKLGEQYKSLTPLLNNNAVSVASLEDAASQLDGPIKNIVARQAEQRKEAAKSAAITKQLAIAQAAAAKRLDAFTVAFDLFGRSVSQVMDKMNDSIKTAEASINALSQVSTNIGAISGTSVFKNLETASNIDIQGAIDDISSFSPDVGSEALRDVADIVKAQRDLPAILRGVVESVAEEAARNTFNTQGGLPEQQSAVVANAIEQGLKARGINLPDKVLKNIQTGLAEDFNRQEGGSGGGDIADILINQGLNKIQGVVGNFGTAARKAMEEAEAGVKAWRNGLIKATNLQLKLTRQQISSQLKINQKQFAIQDKINNVLGKPQQFQARGRLQTQLGAILGSPAQQRAAGAGVVDVGGGGGLRAEQLVNQRKILEQQRRTLESDKQSARLDQDLAKKLKLNADALERNKRATELLANDVSVLSDLERRAANAAQAERDATSGLVGLSRAVDELQASRTPWGTFSRDAVERFNEVTRPITALFRATNAGNLDTRQARSLITAIESGDARIAALLDRLPGGREQADILRRNLALSLGETVRSQLGGMGGPEATGFMQVPSIYQDAIRGSVDDRNNIAEQMRQVGENQNALLSRTMETITDGTLREMSRVNAGLNRTLGQLNQLLRDLFVNRGGEEDKKETIPEFGKGGFVKGPSHAAGGVMAKLEGGEYVIPKGYVNGGDVDEDWVKQPIDWGASAREGWYRPGDDKRSPETLSRTTVSPWARTDAQQVSQHMQSEAGKQQVAAQKRAGGAPDSARRARNYQLEWQNGKIVAGTTVRPFGVSTSQVQQEIKEMRRVGDGGTPDASKMNQPRQGMEHMLNSNTPSKPKPSTSEASREEVRRDMERRKRGLGPAGPSAIGSDEADAKEMARIRSQPGYLDRDLAASGPGAQGYKPAPTGGYNRPTGAGPQRKFRPDKGYTRSADAMHNIPGTTVQMATTEAGLDPYWTTGPGAQPAAAAAAAQQAATTETELDSYWTTGPGAQPAAAAAQQAAVSDDQPPEPTPGPSPTGGPPEPEMSESGHGRRNPATGLFEPMGRPSEEMMRRTGAPTPSLRHMKAFARGQARKRRLAGRPVFRHKHGKGWQRSRSGRAYMGVQQQRGQTTALGGGVGYDRGFSAAQQAGAAKFSQRYGADRTGLRGYGNAKVRAQLERSGLIPTPSKLESNWDPNYGVWRKPTGEKSTHSFGAGAGPVGGAGRAADEPPSLTVPPTRRHPLRGDFGPNTPINRAPAADTPIDQFSTQPRGHMGDPFDYDSQWRQEEESRFRNYQGGFGPAPWTMGGRDQFFQQRYGRQPVQMRSDEYGGMRQRYQQYAGGGRRTALRPAVGGGAPAGPSRAALKADAENHRQSRIAAKRERTLARQEKVRATGWKPGLGAAVTEDEYAAESSLGGASAYIDEMSKPLEMQDIPAIASFKKNMTDLRLAKKAGSKRYANVKRGRSDDERAFWAAIGEGRRGVRAEQKDRRVSGLGRAGVVSQGGLQRQSVAGRARAVSPYSQVSRGQQRYNRDRGASPYSQVSRGQQRYHRDRGASPYSQARRNQERYRRRLGFAAGGSVSPPRGTDTVPAMLTPGEFVINRKSAQAIGPDKLNAMNGYARGGVVQPQYLQNGGYATNGGDVAAQLADSQASMNKLADALGKIPQSIDLNLQGDSRVIIDFGADMVPQVKKYFQEWYQEALKGPQGRRLDGSSPDPSMTNQ